MKQTALMIFLVASLQALSQSPTRMIVSTDPLEFTGEPKILPISSQEQSKFMTLMNKWNEKDATKVRAVRQELDTFILQYPDYYDAYALRVVTDLCYLKLNNYAQMESDVRKAMSVPFKKEDIKLFNLAELHSILAKIQYALKHYDVAIAQLEAAVEENPDTASTVFMSQGVQPDVAEGFLWSKAEIDDLVHRFSKDYRAFLIRGLYLNRFATFDEKYNQLALEEYEHAAALNPRSALPSYFIGQVHTNQSMWTKAAWKSDAVKFQEIRKAALEYTKAINLDPTYVPAYEMRAMSYLQLKESQKAIQDYNKILNFRPDNSGVYHDRALAKMDIGQYRSAIFDFSEAIERRNDEPMMYANRADCYLKLEDYRNAIADLSKAIKLQLGSQGFLFSIHQYRNLYPEFDNLSDDDFIRKLNKLFWPQYTFDVLKKQLTENKEFPIALMSELYEKRGDAYLNANEFRLGVRDFKRIQDAIPLYADSIDRWRQFGTGDAAYLLDVKTVEFSGEHVRLWIKSAIKSKNYVVRSFEIDCRNRTIHSGFGAVYAPDGHMVGSSEVPSDWQPIIPDTQGERLYRGACH